MIQFISHYSERYSYLDSIQLALEGGCRWIQLRMKDATDDEVRPIAIKAQQLGRQYGATFIIDDRGEARRILGSDFIIGGTANTFEDAKAHYEASADYIGCGPFRFTTTKKKLAPVLGLEGYRSIIHQMREAGINIPVVAIGGITQADIPAILQTGITGIALSGTVLRADDPIAEMKHIINIINHE